MNQEAKLSLLLEERRRRHRELVRKWRKANPAKAKVIRLRWYVKNQEKVRAKARLVYAQNREMGRARSALWRANNLEKSRARIRAWYARNRKAASACVKRWQAANPEKRKIYQARNRSKTCGATMAGKGYIRAALFRSALEELNNEPRIVTGSEIVPAVGGGAKA